jgi:hypothetical protein
MATIKRRGGDIECSDEFFSLRPNDDAEGGCHEMLSRGHFIACGMTPRSDQISVMLCGYDAKTGKESVVVVTVPPGQAERFEKAFHDLRVRYQKATSNLDGA